MDMESVYTPNDEQYIEQFLPACRARNWQALSAQRSDCGKARRRHSDTRGRGVQPYKGRFWAYSKENMERFEHKGRITTQRQACLRKAIP